MTSTPIVSTGRGGAGNIGHDDTVYADGGITREAPQGESANGEFSTGRGGAGNIGRSPRLGPEVVADSQRPVDNVPDITTRDAQEEFHTGRGGAGNVYKEKYGGHSRSPDRQGLGEKIKHALHLDKDKKHESSPLTNETTATN